MFYVRFVGPTALAQVLGHLGAIAKLHWAVHAYEMHPLDVSFQIVRPGVNVAKLIVRH
jgi:hypothetical protein